MKITDSKTLAPQADRPSAKPANKNGAALATVASTDSTLSPVSSQLASLQADLSSSQSFDASRVAEIKEAIRDGRLKIDAEAIADKLLADVSALLGPRH